MNSKQANVAIRSSKTLREYALVAGVARLTGINDQTLRDAIQRGDIATYQLADGTTVVRVKDVQQRPKRRPGRQKND